MARRPRPRRASWPAASSRRCASWATACGRGTSTSFICASPYPGIQIFATLRNDFDGAFIRQIMRDLQAVDVDVITANAEYGPGQQEINFAPGWDITAADTAFSFKQGVKEIARQYGYSASFMT